MGARAMIDCICCGRCGKWATATGGGMCEACVVRETRDTEITALAADNVRLRSVLVWLDRIGGLGLQVHARITEALAATPAQSLAAHDSALLREVADGVNKIAVVGAIDTPQSIRDLIADAIRAKADRIAKIDAAAEAPHA